ncbi:hypothetical protein G3N55_11990 [Dissulfurirhabdus thermomarina]|uniref:Uncharacterized protein n=2 Tax=Dissulfurirhabdus thermomarina TaxID=1765737 RepID=A0A6N9TR07_DISTH|nr:hypothetical protein [Dissulfurirhabdus thermomarina]NDY43508.1 hypothetical protein [Dissulfurirhabdus thermomarina]NDY43555.1 hypothetical protein [Dissulfurirhabdus thermomarina]
MVVPIKKLKRFQSENNPNVFVFGEKSVLANWVLNHPFWTASILVFFAIVPTVSCSDRFLKVFIVFSTYNYAIALAARLLCRNLCYKVEYDLSSRVIKFYRCFNSGAIEAPIENVVFLFDRHFAAIYSVYRFTIFNEYMPYFAAIIPGNEIKFSDGIYARYMKWRFKSMKKSLEG